MATTEKYTTIIELNSEQAKRNLEELRKQVEKWKNDIADAKENKMGKSYIASMQKELRAAEKELKKYDNEVARTIDTLNNIGSASVQQIEKAQKSLRKIASEVPHDDELYVKLNEQLDMVTSEMENIKAMKTFEQMKMEAEGATKSAAQLKEELDYVQHTADNAATASVKQLQLAQRTAEGIKNASKQGDDEWVQANGALEKIRARLEEIEDSEKKVVTVIERYNKELEQAGKKAEIVKNDTELVNRTMDKLNSASIRDIEYSIKILNEQLRDTERSGKNVEELTEKLKRLKEELNKVQEMQKPDTKKGNIFSRSVDFLNKNWGAITQVISIFSETRDIVRGSVEAFAEMDQEMNNVRKYTGQTTEEVQKMNDAFKQIDTRTPREKLNQLAGSAGRLGITATEDIMEFVDAADKIGVALGDDLGKDAVDKIGKLAMAFGEDDKKGLRGAMLATGSAVNELAQNSAAQAGYLVEFAARLSGVGIQAGMTQSQILGIGAAMDENMQKDEMAATAISQIITKMTTDSEMFARIAGTNVEEFSKLVRNDMNSALMMFFESMNKKGGFTELAPLFEQMGLDGTRAIAVLSTLASKIDDVRMHQELATEAYEKGTSVISEFKVQNETYQAKLEKARKAFQDLRIELGEKLLPVASMAISSTSMFVRVLNLLITFLTENYKILLTLTTTITAYVVVANLAAIKTKVLTAATLLQNNALKAARVAWLALNTAMKSNPWALVISGLTAVVGLLASYYTKAKEAAKSTDYLADAQKKARQEYVETEAMIRTLEKVMRDERIAIDERRKAIGKLKEIIPGYNAMLSKEGKLINDNRDAIENYLKSFRKQILLKVYQDKIVEIINLQEELKEKQDSLIAGYRENNLNGQTAKSPYFKNLQDYEKYLELGEKIKELQFKEREIMNKVGEDSRDKPDRKTVESSGTGDTLAYWRKVLDERKKELAALRSDANATATSVEEAAKRVKEAEAKIEVFTNAKGQAKQLRDADKERKNRERKADDAAKAETERQMAELTHRYAMGRILYCDYIDEQERIQLEGIERRMLIYKTESLEYQKLSRKREEMLLNGSEETRKLTLEQMKQEHENRLSAIEEQAWKENLTEQEKNDMVFREDMRFLDEQRILYKKGTLERINLEHEIEEKDNAYRVQREQNYQQKLIQVREQYLGVADQRVYELALKNLDELHAAKLLSEKEYQEALMALKAQYAGYETKSETDSRIASNALKVATDNAKRKVDNDGSQSTNLPIVGDIILYRSTMEQLEEMYKNDEITHEQYLAAKQQATSKFCTDLASSMQAAYQSVSNLMSAASSYFSAQQDYETALVQKKYEKQIEAAGNNQKKVKKLQEKQQEEEAAIKTKYNKKAAAIQVSQALAQTAMSAINAYSSAAAVPVIGYILAPIAAAAAVAAGMLQVAAIKKQQQAQEAGYYEGGFTGGRRYRREAGVVHEGEFVANHKAVQNPNILPFLNFIDQAQRNNTVGSLTMQDVSRSMGFSGTAQVVAPIVNVKTDNEELIGTLAQVNETIGILYQQVANGINATVAIDGPQGLHKQYSRFLKLNNRP